MSLDVNVYCSLLLWSALWPLSFSYLFLHNEGKVYVYPHFIQEKKKSVLPNLCSTMSTLLHKALANHFIGCSPAQGYMLSLRDSLLVESVVARETGSQGKEQTFSNLSVHLNHQETWWKCRLWLSRCGLWHDFSISSELPGDANVAGPQTTLWVTRLEHSDSEDRQSVWEVCGCEMVFHVEN